MTYLGTMDLNRTQTSPFRSIEALRRGIEAGERAALARRNTAGGLTAANIVEAVERVRPYAVDLSSSLEAQPGRKDAVHMHRFFDQLKQA